MAVRRGFLSLICSCLLSSASLCWLCFFSSVLDGKNRPTVCVCASAHMRKPKAWGTVVDSGAGTACQVAEGYMRKSERENDITHCTFLMSAKQSHVLYLISFLCVLSLLYLWGRPGWAVQEDATHTTVISIRVAASSTLRTRHSAGSVARLHVSTQNHTPFRLYSINLVKYTQLYFDEKNLHIIINTKYLVWWKKNILWEKRT